MGRQEHDGNGGSAGGLPFIFLAVLLVLGSAMLFVASVEWFGRDTMPYVLVQQFGSTLIGAAIIGFTYEWLLHKRREQMFRTFAEEQLRATIDALDAFVATTPREIFSLLEDIATRVEGKVPTLYTPAREQDSEYTFAGSVDYFTDLIHARRVEVVGVLRTWIKESSNPKLKFLASDFIGLFKLHELRDELLAQLSWANWENTDWITKAWRLNYCWAASRADPGGMYRGLAQVMRNTPHADVKRWVLFIPRQMKDPEFIIVVREFLERDDLTSENVAWLIPALAELWEADERGIRNLLRRHRSRFNNELLVKELTRVWREHNISPDTALRLIGAKPLHGLQHDPAASVGQ